MIRRPAGYEVLFFVSILVVKFYSTCMVEFHLNNLTSTRTNNRLILNAGYFSKEYIMSCILIQKSS